MTRFAPTTHRVSLIAAVLLAAVLALPATLKSGEPPTAAGDKPALYDPQADAGKQIAEAVVIAKRDHKRVLLMFGYNQCIWCHRLHGLFKSDRRIARKLLYEYEFVMIDNGSVEGKINNAAVNARYGNPDKINGWPVLVVLDAEGKQLTTQETAALEEGDHHVPAKVLAFLEKWQAPPVSAEDILAKALSKAKAESKKAFVYFSAPWCPYCHKLDAYLRTPEIATVFNQAYVPVKIDVDRMTGGKEMDARYRGSTTGGIPFFAVLDADGNKLADAHVNVGFPVQPFEINHFIRTVRRTAPDLTTDQIKVLEKGLQPEKKETQQDRITGFSVPPRDKD